MIQQTCQFGFIFEIISLIPDDNIYFKFIVWEEAGAVPQKEHFVYVILLLGQSLSHVTNC